MAARALRLVPVSHARWLGRATICDGVPIAPVDTILVTKLIAGRTQDLADIEAIVESGADREGLREAVGRALPGGAKTFERLFANVDRQR